MVMVHNNVVYEINHFCSHCGCDLTKSLEHGFTTKWKQISILMEDGSKLTIPVEVSETIAQSTFIIASKYMKQILCYIQRRAKDERVVSSSSYSTGTQSKRIPCCDIFNMAQTLIKPISQQRQLATKQTAECVVLGILTVQISGRSAERVPGSIQCLVKEIIGGVLLKFQHSMYMYMCQSKCSTV